MRRLLRLSLLVVLFGLCASLAQDTREFRYNGSGYATLGIGRCQHQVTNLSVGGGGDVFLWRGLAAGAELGYFRFVERRGKGFGIATLNLGYHFVNRAEPGKFDPFVSTGLPGVAFGGGGRTAAVSLGGGLTYWFSRRAGLRAEGRVYGLEEEGIAMFRIGLSFR